MRTLLLILLLSISGVISANKKSCKTDAELKSAIKNAVPGDTIVLKNQIWNNLHIEFFAEGTENAPIVLKSEEFGKVFLEGESYLMLRGSYLIVDGLIFRNGHSPISAIISYKKSSEEVANNCRVTNCVIDQFSNTDRYERNYWIAFYGKNNRLDHCYFAGKLNYGALITVWLGNDLSVENNHRIDHNYIGHRPRLGSNGGEIIRIGSSKNSMVSSNTIIENNYFEHCNGETEIVSIKACDNIIQNNTFFECEGSLVLRHGNRNIVRDNRFIGNQLPYTGGIRVIGEGHKIYNNYFKGLRGREFRAPLVLMNGIPNSALNRYFQVRDVIIANNTWVDCTEPWLFGMGIKDETNTVPPESSLLAYNVVFSQNQGKGIVTLDDISGLHFYNNLFSSNLDYNNISGISSIKNETGKPDSIIDYKNYSLYHEDIGAITSFLDSLGISNKNNGQDYEIANAKNTGPIGYKPISSPNYTPYHIKVEPGNGTLDCAINEAKPGAILDLSGGEYIINKRLKINNPIVIRGSITKQKTMLKQHSDENTKIFFEINYGGSLKLENLIFDGEAYSKNPSKYAVTTAKEKMAKPFGFKAINCTFLSFTSVMEGGAIFKAYKGSFADSIVISNCKFIDIYRGIDLDEENDDKGIYNAEHVIIENTLFKNIEKYAISFYRGGKDESTFGPHLAIDHCVFDNVNNNPNASILVLVGVQKTNITNSIFTNSPKAKNVVELYGKYNVISHCNIYAAGQIGVQNGAKIGKGMLYYNPMFASDNYALKSHSSLLGKADDGQNIGLILDN